MYLVFLLGSVVLQAWAWRGLSRRVRAGALGRFQGAIRYTGWAFLPVPLLVAVFFAMVGLEELFGVALVEERGALLALPVLALSLLGSLAFWARSAFFRKVPRAG